MSEQSPAWLWAWTTLAAVAGALTALSAKPFANMSKTEIMLALFVGSSFAVFVGPWAVHLIYGGEPIDLRIMGGIYYIMASASNVLIPLLVRKLSSAFGATETKA